MSEYTDRIKQLRARWNKTPPAEGGGIVFVPEGSYQAEITKAQLNKETYKVRWAFKITRGSEAGTILYRRDDLLRESKEKGQPGGLAYFFQLMKTLGLGYASPEAKDITRELKKAIGMVCSVFVKHAGAFQNVYVNSLIDAGIEDENTDDTEEEEETEEDEDDTNEENEDTEEEDDEDVEEELEDDEEEEEPEIQKVILLHPEGTLLTFKHEGKSYKGRYVGPADDKISIIAVENDDGELEEWEVENDALSRPPGRPLGAPNKKTKKKKKKGKKAKAKPPEKEDEAEVDDDDDWGDEWEDE